MPFPGQVERWRALVRDLSPDDLKDDPGFQRIVLATITAESGGNPEAVGDQGHSVGLAQLHDQGMGSGLSRAQRSDPRVNLGRAVPALARAYRATGGNPALTYKQAINPGAALNGPQVTGVMSAYQQGGGPVDPQDDRTKGATERATGVPPRQPAPPSPTIARITRQLTDAHTRLEAAQQRLAAASTPPTEQPVGPIAQAAFDKAEQRRLAEQRDARREVASVQKEIGDLEKQATDEAEKQAKAPKPPASQKPTTTATNTTSPYILTTRPDGTQEWSENPNYRTGAKRTYQAGGATYTESADEAGGFAPLPSGVHDPYSDLTANESASLPISQQNADSSSLSAAAAQLHAQVAKGTLDFNTAKTAFDYIVAQQAPVEEGGKLYQSGYEPSSHIRQFLHLNTEPYNVIDAASFYGRPELNQYVRGSYPFGAGPMSPQEYQQRQAGTFQGAPPQAPQVAPVPPGRAGPPQPMMDENQGDGGFVPPPPQAPQQQVPSGPAFGGVTQPMSEPPIPAQPPPQAPDGDLQKIVAMLVQKGFPPEIAQQAAQQHLGMGGMPAQY